MSGNRPHVNVQISIRILWVEMFCILTTRREKACAFAVLHALRAKCLGTQLGLCCWQLTSSSSHRSLDWKFNLQTRITKFEIIFWMQMSFDHGLNARSWLDVLKNWNPEKYYHLIDSLTGRKYWVLAPSPIAIIALAAYQIVSHCHHIYKIIFKTIWILKMNVMIHCAISWREFVVLWCGVQLWLAKIQDCDSCRE